MSAPINTPGRGEDKAAPPTVSPGVHDQSEAARRVPHLFRRTTRAGLVHPLLHLVLRYREGPKC